jgi:endonuclease/exonuclease/phosphatase family metal-dependent hydrolase
MTRTVSDLQTINPDDYNRILAAPRTSEAHRQLLASLPGMNVVQCGGAARAQRLPDTFPIVAWNLERCLFPEDSAAHLAQIAPQVVLLSEMDHGMARTKQCHTTAEMAQALGMTYAFGVEFFEMDLGGETERAFCEDDSNACGWHGNAILSAVPFEKVTMIRLDDHGHWYTQDADVDAGQPRVGGRNAIAAVVPTASGLLCVVSTHLESNADGPHRAVQFDVIMAAVDAFAPGLPVVIGGDLNTGNHMPPDFDWRSEALFANAEARGYDWSFTADGMTTRPSLITPHPARQMKLDWICGRRVGCVSKGILPSVDLTGKPLSDHDAVFSSVSVGPH